MSEELDKVEDKVEEKAPEAPVLSDAEQRAQGFGWMPKEAWIEAGKSEDEWVPAVHFNKFGELKRQNIEKEKEITKQRKLFEKMKEHHLKVRADAEATALERLKAERKLALKENDLVRAEEVRDAIEELKDEFDSMPEIPEEVAAEAYQPGPAPEFLEFVDRNPWYKQTNKDEISVEADALGDAIKRRNPTISNTELLAAVEKKIQALYPDKFKDAPNPQHDSSSRKSPSVGNSGHGLTKEQQEVADAFQIDYKTYAKELKGETKMVMKIGGK